jgi:hypothetical protein
LVLPLYQGDTPTSSRAIPVRWEMAPVVKKPGKNASPDQLQEYKREKKEKNLSHQFVTLLQELRQHLNQTGHASKVMITAVDGSFCNSTVFAPDWEKDKVTIVARSRKDIMLCKRAPGKGRRFYGKTKFTPQQVRTRDSLAPWKTAEIFHGGCLRNVAYKEISNVYWQGGAKQRPLRVIVVAPVGYRTSKNGRKYYRKPAYLLTTDLETPAAILLQAYFDRWGIEVNHRDEKEILGVGEAQVWNEKSVTKVPALLVAMYSWLLLAGLACYGPTRTSEYAPLPKWRRAATRPSCLDLVTLLRKQLAETPFQFPTGNQPPTYEAMVQTAAA